MSQLQQYERDAIAMAKRISDLKSLTPQFIDARDQAQRSMEKHYQLIKETEADLADLRAEAAALASRLGEDVLAAEVEPTAEAIEAILNDATPFPGCDPLDPRQGSDVIAEMVGAGQTGFADVDNFATVGEVAEHITAALADMAGEQPANEDESDAPELTTEQVERVEDNIAAALRAYG